MKNYLMLSVLMALSACGGGGSSTPISPSIPAPTVSINLSAQKVWVGDTVKITWASSNTSSCTGVDGFNGVLPINGTLDFKPTTSGQFKYTLSCSGTGGTGSGTQTVTADAVIATFSNSVIKNIDGSLIGAEKTFSAGEFTFSTGIWGEKSASIFNISQNNTVNLKESVASLNSDWDITSSATPGTVMFGNVTFGKHPGWDKSTTNKLPIQINAMPDIWVKGTVKTTCLTVCGFGTILDVFVMESSNSKSTDIGTEILIVTENTNGKPDAGYIGAAVINGIEFKVYHNAFPSSWNTIGYSPVNQYSQVSLNMKDFLNDAMERGFIKRTDYLVSIEVGTEVTFGKGKTNINDLQIN